MSCSVRGGGRVWPAASGLLCLLFGAPAAHAQLVLAETSLGQGQFGDGSRGIAVSNIAGDTRPDLLLRRGDAAGGFLELWERNDAGAFGFLLGPDLGIVAPVRDAIVVDIEFDGDGDIVVATTDPNDSLILLLNRQGEVAPGEPRLQRSPQRFALPDLRSLAPFDVRVGMSFVGAVVAVQGNASPNLVLRWNGSGGLVALAQTFPHVGNARTAVGMVADASVSGAALLTVGPAPQRVWQPGGGTFTELAITGLNRDLLLALCTDFDADGDSDVVSGAVTGEVEVWINQGGLQGGTPGAFLLSQQLGAASEGVPVAIEVMQVQSPPTAHPDVLVSRQRFGSYSTRIFRVDVPTLQLSARAQTLLSGQALAVDRASNTLFSGDFYGIRSFARVGATSAPEIGFAITSTIYGLQGYGLPVELLSTQPVAAGTSQPSVVSPLASYLAFFPDGQIRATVELSRQETMASGSFNISLGAPSMPGVTLRPPLEVPVVVFPADPTNPSNFCTVECLMFRCSVSFPRSAKATIPPNALMGTEAETQTLRNFRDGVLNVTAKGREYIDLYEQFEMEFYVVTLQEPSFYRTLWDAKDAWMPAMESLVNSNGSAPITTDMADKMDLVFAHFRSNGSRALREAIVEQYEILSPRDFVGQPISALSGTWALLPPLEVFESGFETTP